MQTQTQTFMKQVPIALEAIAIHMREHDLPITTSIDVYPHSQVIRVRVVAGQAGVDRWLSSLTVVAAEKDDVAHPALGFRTAWTVSLPDIGIRFELIGHSPARVLTAVPA